MSKQFINIPGTLKSVASDGIVAYSDSIYDEVKNKTQETLNSEVSTQINNINNSINQIYNLNQHNEDGVFITYWDGTDTTKQYIIKPSQLSTAINLQELYNNRPRYIIVGVVIFDGTKPLVISPNYYDDSIWGDTIIREGNTAISLNVGLKDFDGVQNTNKILNQLRPNNAYLNSIAKCKELYEYNVYPFGGNGYWYTPALGELMAINFNLTKINYALSFIENSDPISIDDEIWSSTEYNDTKAYSVVIGKGIKRVDKKDYNASNPLPEDYVNEYIRKVRPVSTITYLT